MNEAVDHPAVKWPRSLLYVVAVLQVAILGLLVSPIIKWPSQLYPETYSDVDLSPVESKLSEIADAVEAVRVAANRAEEKADDAHGTGLEIRSDLSKLAITGVRCSPY